MFRRVISWVVGCLLVGLVPACGLVGNEGFRARQFAIQPVEAVNWSIFDEPYFEVAAFRRKSKNTQRLFVRLEGQPYPSYQLRDPDRTECFGYIAGASDCFENHLSVPTRRSESALEYDITAASPTKFHIIYVGDGEQMVVLARPDRSFAVVLSRDLTITQNQLTIARDVLSENGFDPQELKVVK
ncbi:lipocalin family protein [Ruegeria faecimaris]|uniref:lipocalin family protein n=1 Tax=Ruegeria faecimaris TaxID=686389 RepID=UPI002492F8D4|nr:lipocalin family protein [Ruegeria faecimaris]